MRPKRHSWLGLAGVAIALGGVVFAGGRYPDRSEVERTHERTVDAVEALRGQVHALDSGSARELARLRTQLEAVENQLRQERERQAVRSRK